MSACETKDRHLHVDVFWGQSEIVQIIVSRCVSIGVQTCGEVTAGHGDTHYTVADTCHKTQKKLFKEYVLEDW